MKSTAHMKHSLFVLSNHSLDSRPSLLLQFDSARYLFNCPEGSQRISTQHKTRFMRANNIFLSRFHWDTHGGLPGFLITLNDIENRQDDTINLFGHSALNHFMNASKSFKYQMTLDVKIRDVTAASEILRPVHVDENVSISAIPISDESRKRKRMDTGDAVDDTEPIKTNPASTVVQYLIETQDIPGKFDADMAKKLGIPRGPVFGLLF